MQKAKQSPRSGRLLKDIWKSKEIYLLALPAVVWLFVFCYMPMPGIQLAFKTYKAKLGIWGSPWVGFTNFRSVFRDPALIRSIGITLWMSLWKLILCFPAPILLALILNELRMPRYKKCLQTVFTFPHFLSWIIVAGIMKNLFSVNGPVNGILYSLGMDKIMFFGTRSLFRPLLYITDIWKEAGWSCILYLAAISGIDQEQYEAAEIDGASRLQRIWYITLPCIKSTILVLLILQVGAMLGSNFDQIYNLQNDVVSSTAETLSLYIFRITFQRTPNYGVSTAVGLCTSVVNLFLLVGANSLAKKFGGAGLMGGAFN